MNVAVHLGAPKNQPFTAYVDYLEANHYVPPGAKTWVDAIRKKGNDATHEIPATTKEDARELIDFVEMLLKLVFEFPARAGSAKGKSTTP